MKSIKNLATKLVKKQGSYGLAQGKVKKVSPSVIVDVADISLREGKELVLCALPCALEIGQTVLVYFFEDNSKAYLMGVIK